MWPEQAYYKPLTVMVRQKPNLSQMIDLEAVTDFELFRICMLVHTRFHGGMFSYCTHGRSNKLNLVA